MLSQAWPVKSFFDPPQRSLYYQMRSPTIAMAPAVIPSSCLRTSIHHGTASCIPLVQRRSSSHAVLYTGSRSFSSLLSPMPSIGYRDSASASSWNRPLL
ncbi:hypothetical protein OUZ56_026536 [Daphnia magna]|uniref:Uncharacterized protein n=1 Tax=Daphnia magna TaxID=35525 RepID=A0ABQ9ZMG2_9CRUS|nr:hypothetical protein OUZ56_026536 [Daphnia magna]